MANPLASASGLVPAQLGFLAIYNPSLGTTDETVNDQIVYYASASSLSASKRRRHRAAAKDGRPTDAISNQERNERLRQIGLAQGMVEFGKSFSGGKPVDSIDTERSRVVLHELEPGWWILASIDLTRLPLPPTKTTGTSASTTSAPSPPPAPPSSAKGTTTTTTSQSQQPPTPQYEYSSREVKPAILLLQDLLRAHALFLLHHGPSLSSCLASTSPSTSASSSTATLCPHFTALLARYWDLFLSTWPVLLHGNPACGVLGGIKVAACGELGIGVGEEDRGSGEREVLEGLVGRVEGLVDLVVGRFGSAAPGGGGGVDVGKKGKGLARRGGGEEEGGWLGLGSEVGAEGGVVFLGVGALSRRSLWAVASWVEDIYMWGESAYGVVEVPAGSPSRARKRRGAGKKAGAVSPSSVSTGKKDPAKAKPAAAELQPSGDIRATDRNASAPEELPETAGAGGGVDKMLSYLKLGYGTYWSLGTSSPATISDADDEPQQPEGSEDVESQKPLKDLDAGYFLVGLDERDAEIKQPDSAEEEHLARQRTVTVELAAQDFHGSNAHTADLPNTNTNKSKKTNLRPVVYVHRPFIYVLLFRPDRFSPSSWSDLSQSLHTQFTPLHKPLVTSTAYRPEKPTLAGPAATSQTSRSEIYDLVFDTDTLTIHSTIPNIPDPVFLLADTSPSSNTANPEAACWTRVEALNTHNQILNMFAATRGDQSAVEETCKTSRGWWVVWNRVVDHRGASAGDSRSLSSSPSAGGPGAGGGGTAAEEDDDVDEGDGSAARGCKDIFLIRRASDHAGGGSGGGVRAVSASYVGGGGGGWTDGASRLAQGIGVDTRRYIEGLLSLNR
ncbi:hypothetical protein N658DRAFT_466151 [Parathielavia hyrcaniae]|uniref:CCZ1/INTU/HSP4 first Longin domain-containing protein n=1 Tax=Parathielavia hyrcaniae TaxID=113614 RepID=A0AAN6T477_9PEZI|nr:hypothetical protein N658DRAFT_466151 [Parathielavia hyrcaniae]